MSNLAEDLSLLKDSYMEKAYFVWIEHKTEFVWIIEYHMDIYPIGKKHRYKKHRKKACDGVKSIDLAGVFAELFLLADSLHHFCKGFFPIR